MAIVTQSRLCSCSRSHLHAYSFSCSCTRSHLYLCAYSPNITLIQVLSLNSAWKLGSWAATAFSIFLAGKLSLDPEQCDQ